MAYFRGQEIGDAVIIHHLYEHNIRITTETDTFFYERYDLIIAFPSENQAAITQSNFETIMRNNLNKIIRIAAGIRWYDDGDYGDDINGYITFVEEEQTEALIMRIYNYNSGSLTLEREKYVNSEVTAVEDNVRKIF